MQIPSSARASYGAWRTVLRRSAFVPPAAPLFGGQLRMRRNNRSFDHTGLSYGAVAMQRRGFRRTDERLSVFLERFVIHDPTSDVAVTVSVWSDPEMPPERHRETHKAIVASCKEVMGETFPEDLSAAQSTVSAALRRRLSAQGVQFRSLSVVLELSPDAKTSSNADVSGGPKVTFSTAEVEAPANGSVMSPYLLVGGLCLLAVVAVNPRFAMWLGGTLWASAVALSRILLGVVASLGKVANGALAVSEALWELLPLGGLAACIFVTHKWGYLGGLCAVLCMGIVYVMFTGGM